MLVSTKSFDWSAAVEQNSTETFWILSRELATSVILESQERSRSNSNSNFIYLHSAFHADVQPKVFHRAEQRQK